MITEIMLKKEMGTGGSLKVPEQLYATTGLFNGEVNIQWDSLKNAKQYVVQISSGSSAGWIQVDIINEPLYKFSSLKKGRTYKFRVAAVFSKGQGPWSRPVIKKI